MELFLRCTSVFARKVEGIRGCCHLAKDGTFCLFFLQFQILFTPNAFHTLVIDAYAAIVQHYRYHPLAYATIIAATFERIAGSGYSCMRLY